MGRRSSVSDRSTEERLRLFCDRVQDTRNRPAIRDLTIRAGFTIGDGRLDVDTGNEEHNRSLMMDLRLFLSPREDVFFLKIASLLETRLTDDELRDANRHNRGEWLSAVKKGWGKFIVNVEPYTPYDFFDLIVNGDMFHLDKKKADRLGRFSGSVQALAPITVNLMAIDCVQILIAERLLILRALKEDAVRLDDRKKWPASSGEGRPPSSVARG